MSGAFPPVAGLPPSGVCSPRRGAGSRGRLARGRLREATGLSLPRPALGLHPQLRAPPTSTGVRPSYASSFSWSQTASGPRVSPNRSLFCPPGRSHFFLTDLQCSAFVRPNSDVRPWEVESPPSLSLLSEIPMITSWSHYLLTNLTHASELRRPRRGFAQPCASRRRGCWELRRTSALSRLGMAGARRPGRPPGR